eukprot:scaffold73025_cov29-Phaeocystis_antarctica.AAC.1
MRTALAGRLNSCSVSRSEPTVVFWFGTGSRRHRLRTKISTVRRTRPAWSASGRGLLGHHGPGVRARPSRFLHQPQDASGLDNLIQTQTTPAERGCTLVALAYILDGVHLRPQASSRTGMHTHARAHTRTHTVRADQERFLPKHVCAPHCTHDRQRASLAATSYNLLPLNLLPLRCRAVLRSPATAAEGLRTASPPACRGST